IAPIVTRVIASQNAARTSRLLMTTRTEPMTSNTLRMMNAMSSQSTSTASHHDPDALRGLHGTSPDDSEARRNENRKQGIGDQPLPSDVQDLINPHSGDGPGEPHEERGKQVDPQEEPHFFRHDWNGDPSDGQRREHGTAPPAQVQDRNQRGGGQHPQPLEREDDAEAHPAVLRRPALD